MKIQQTWAWFRKLVTNDMCLSGFVSKTNESVWDLVWRQLAGYKKALTPDKDEESDR